MRASPMVCRRALRLVLVAVALGAAAVLLVQGASAAGPAPTISAGEHHTCASIDGVATCWGYGAMGQLGNGTMDMVTGNLFVTSPVSVIGLPGPVTAVSAGGYHSCAIVAGAAYCWGENNFGQLGDGTTTYRSTAVPVVGLSSGVTAIAAGWGGTCAVVNGGARCWGSNWFGQIGDGTRNDSSTPVPVAGLGSGVTAISQGYSHTCAAAGGAAYCWGYIDGADLGAGTGSGSDVPVPVADLTSGVTAIAAGMVHSCAVANGAAYCWGYGGNGQLGTGSTAAAPTPVPVSGLSSGVTAISVAGRGFWSCAVVNGAAECWGSNLYGGVGDGTTAVRYAPVLADGLSSGVTAIATGQGHSCAIVDGAVTCWGFNAYGQLGDGTTIDNQGPPPDTTAPSITVPASVRAQIATSTSSGATAVFTVSAIDGRDGVVVPACSRASGSVFLLGTTLVTCTASDAAGNHASASFPVTVSAAAFGVTPSAVSTVQQASFSWGALFATRYTCSLDEAAFAACSSPRVYHGLAAGPHRLCVMATQDVQPQCFAWTIVSPGKPVVTISSVTVNGRSATLAFTADQPATRFTCSLDGAAYRTCSSPLTYNGLGRGTHTVSVVSTNFAGDASAVPAVASFAIS